MAHSIGCKSTTGPGLLTDFEIGGASEKPALLVLSHRLPFPPHNGAAIRTLGLLQGLSRAYALTVLCFDRRDAALDTMSLAERMARVREFGTVEVTNIRQQDNRWRFLSDHLSSIATGLPYTHFVHRSPAYDALLEDALTQRNFVGVHVDTIDLVRFLPRVASLPLLLTHHNIESQLLRRRAKASSSFAAAAYMRHQADLVERAERRWSGEAALNVVTSEQDASELGRISPAAAIQVIPNAVAVDGTTPVDLEGDKIVFVGGMNYFPNLEALHWFGGEVLPILRAGGYAGEVQWIGRATDHERQELGARYGVTLTGYVSEIRPYFEGAGCFVAPLRTGGGTRLKILDAWSHGLPVVSTSVGCEGLQATEGDELLTGDTAAEFATAVARVLNDASLRRQLAAKGRALVQGKFSWAVVGRRLVEAYQSTLAHSSESSLIRT